MGSGLDHHEDGSPGAYSIIGRVVAVERLELSQRIDRRQGAEAAAAAAIVQFSSVEHVEVMRAASSVETNSVGGGQSRNAAECRQRVGDTKAQSSKRGYIAAIRSQLSDLLTGDQGAELTGLRLHLERVRLHGDRLGRVADREGDVLF